MSVRESNNQVKQSDVIAPSKPVNRLAAEQVDEEIRPGQGGILTSIPSEPIYEDADLGDEVDLAKSAKKKLQKPGRREWIVLNKASEYQTRLLVHSPGKDDIEKHHYWVHPNLRAPVIREELKGHRIFLYYSTRARTFRLWPMPVTEGNSWYESLVSLLAFDEDWFRSHEIKVIPDKSESEYRVRQRPVTKEITWPGKSVDELLAEAIGPDRIITLDSHPLYVELIAGQEIELD